MMRSLQRTRLIDLPEAEWVLCVVGDVDRDGTDEIMLASRWPQVGLNLAKHAADGTWRLHRIDGGYDRLEAGGALVDIAGNGRLDFVAGGDWQGRHLYWWECPADPTKPWTCRLVAEMSAAQSHDQLAADIDGDGRDEIYFWNQGARSPFAVRIPANPRITPWPNIQAIATDVCEEGLAAADVDGDGRPELLAGQRWYKPRSDGTWESHAFAEGFVSPRLTAADFDGDGSVEIILAEGDASWHGREFGRLARFSRPHDPTAIWRCEILDDQLADPHTVCVGDLRGTGEPVLAVGELGDPRGQHPHPPTVRLYESRAGTLTQTAQSSGVGCHEGKIMHLGPARGLVGKPFRCLEEGVVRPPGTDALYLWRLD